MRRGFGTTVIEQTIPFELQGRTDVRYAPSGVEADFFIPTEHAVAVDKEERSRDGLQRPCVPICAAKRFSSSKTA